MSISPLPASHNTMALMMATHTAPARGAAEANTDGAGRQGQDDDEQFVSALSAASSSKGAEDTTISEDDSSEGPRTKQKPAKAPEEDSGRRAILAQAWHTTMTGMPPSDSAGALALPAALLAHGQLALGGASGGDIDADAPPVAVVGIGVVTEGEGGIVTGPVLNPATLGLNARGLAELPAPGAADAGGGAPSTRAFGLPDLTVVPAAEARPAVEAAITANANSAAAAAALAEVDLAAFAEALLGAGAPGTDATGAGASGTGGPGFGLPGAGGPGGGVPGAGAGGLGGGVPGAGGTGAAGGAGGIGAAGAGGPGGAGGLGAGGAGDAGGVGGVGSAGGPGFELGAAGLPPVTKSGRQLSAAELAATQATAAQNAAAQVAAVQATAAQLGQFLAADDATTLTAAPVPGPGGPIPAPVNLAGYVPGAALDTGTTGDTGTDRDAERGSGDGFTDALAAANTPATPDATGFTPLHTPDLTQAQQIDLTGANAPDQAPPPPPATQVADQIIPLRTQGDGVHRIAMELRPNDLGTISVVAEIRNGQVHLHFGGANEMTRETLRAALPELRQQLEDAGFSGAAFDFSDAPAGQQNRQQFATTGQGPGGQTGRGGQTGDTGGAENGRPAPQRAPGYPEPTPTDTGRHGLDLQV
ncbi:flagellar hook-length control protein FliK [Cryptosporangium sp. NPDC048952]|uniref:flagellar hook-length control protein FliK n=1 Tax=Cryptosporangium sp. NPDC048952 TaxID=3363961 RepID=UPI003723B172